jgi:16S rRNA (uracil1498-N3)-methyltransferase
MDRLSKWQLGGYDPSRVTITSESFDLRSHHPKLRASKQSFMTHRTWLNSISGAVVRIEDQEAHHLLNVLRLEVGDSVELFDGAGAMARGTIQSVTRKSLDVQVTERHTVPKSTLPTLTVAAAPPKGDRLRWMVEKLTELGVSRLILLKTDRSVVSPGETRLDRLQSYVVGACKQSGRNRLMEILGPVQLDSLLQQTSEPSNTTDRPLHLFLAHPENSAQGLRKPESEMPGLSSSESTDVDPMKYERVLLIGPEGGFTDSEVSRIRESAGSQLSMISWPESILRIETAAIVFSTVLLSKAVPN